MPIIETPRLTPAAQERVLRFQLEELQKQIRQHERRATTYGTAAAYELAMATFLLSLSLFTISTQLSLPNSNFAEVAFSAQFVISGTAPLLAGMLFRDSFRWYEHTQTAQTLRGQSLKAALAHGLLVDKEGKLLPPLSKKQIAALNFIERISRNLELKKTLTVEIIFLTSAYEPQIHKNIAVEPLSQFPVPEISDEDKDKIPTGETQPYFLVVLYTAYIMEPGHKPKMLSHRTATQLQTNQDRAPAQVLQSAGITLKPKQWIEFVETRIAETDGSEQRIEDPEISINLEVYTQPTYLVADQFLSASHKPTNIGRTDVSQTLLLSYDPAVYGQPPFLDVPLTT